jgi:16S rRNA (cytosine967-C5)-methyltransferase
VSPQRGPVSLARRVAFEVIRRTFEEGAFADRALPAVATRAGLDRRDRGQAQRLAYGAIERCGTADALIASLAQRPVAELEPAVLAALRLGLFELLFADATPDHAAVDQAVELAKRGGARRGAGLVNAVLRRAARERTALVASLDDDTAAAAAIAHSLPAWLAELWWRELGAEDARSLMRASNVPAENALRVNPLRAELDAKLAEFTAIDGVRMASGPAPLAPRGALVVEGPLPDRILAGLARGELVAQSRASQAVVEVLEPRSGERILDLCAGPGIKTTAIAARVGEGGELVAVEAASTRASQIRELCDRLGARAVRVVEADAAGDDLGAGYDRVLVDPPCSDLGTLAARPDARWRKSPETIARLADLQRRILAAGVRALRPGGTLVYSTCTISAAENEAAVRDVLDAGDDLEADHLGAAFGPLASPRDRRFLQTRPDRDRTAGFFIARLAKG